MNRRKVIQISVAGIALSTMIVIGCGGGLPGSDSARPMPSRVDICGTPTPTLTEMMQVEMDLTARPRHLAGGNITIPVYVHVITNNTGLGDVSDAVISFAIMQQTYPQPSLRERFLEAAKLWAICHIGSIPWPARDDMARSPMEKRTSHCNRQSRFAYR